MSEDTKPNASEDGWVMPQPIFRSTPGRTPGKTDEVPAESDTSGSAAGSANEVRPAPMPVASKAPAGCRTTVGMAVLLIVVGLMLIGALVTYFLVFYRAAETTF